VVPAYKQKKPTETTHNLFVQDDSAWYLQHPERTYININEAAKVGDFDSLKSALQKGVHIDTRDKYYKTPLMTASLAGHFDMVKFLVEKGYCQTFCGRSL